MKRSRTKWGVIIVGAVAALTLGAIGVAGAASSSTPTPSPNASGQAGQGRGFDSLSHGGGGDLAQALANLSGKDVATIEQQRAAGTSIVAIATSYGVSEEQLLAEVTKLETAELDAAVKAGQITDAQRAQILSGLQAELKAELTETDAGGGPGGHGDGDGPQGSATGGATTSPTTATSYLTY